ncbi:MAG: sigma-70 family RNA polymerase sigma factor [Acidobacteria bacterium]|nr:MAG: sigma-70 family RNA polymerase sigma factor [Acidobacteriota bacterium]REK09771.1 MAG: sigma-70 family RNA polymerase sigma factor [Acidobacteriota bacterium]
MRHVCRGWRASRNNLPVHASPTFVRWRTMRLLPVRRGHGLRPHDSPWPGQPLGQWSSARYARPPCALGSTRMSHEANTNAEERTTPSSDPSPADTPLASTATLIGRIREGDQGARELLVQRCLPALRRWARGRLPAYGRSLSDTDDMVQVTLMRALQRVEHFDPGREGAFLAYLRQTLVNTVRTELRTVSRRPRTEPMDEELSRRAGTAASQELVAELDAYEKALERLPATRRHAVVLRLEFGLTFPEIAEELDLPSADAARMSVSRSMVELAKELA